MKKILFISILLLAGLQPALAKNVKVEAMSDFSTANPPKTWQVKILEGFTMESGFQVNSGSKILGNIESTFKNMLL